MNTSYTRLVLVTAALAPLPAQTSTWLLRTTAIGATPRFDHALAYDSSRQRVVMFGGDTGTARLADTVEWDGGASTWVVRAPTTSPAARRHHAMAFDAARQRIVLFGGEATGGSSFADTWEWNGANWLLRTPAATPPARHEHAMVYDEVRQRVVLFGGRNASNLFGDTWEWNGSNWVAPLPATSPWPRSGHAMAFDSLRQVTVLFGGNGAAETWEWDGSTWTHRTPTTTPPANDVAMTYDTVQQRVVMFGGNGTTTLTWHWDGQDWQQALPTTMPQTRTRHAMAFDVARYRTVLFGGQGPFIIWGDTWDYRGAFVPATAVPYGTGCGQPALGLVPDANARPLLGQVGGATIINAPTTLAAVALGWNDQVFGPYQLPVPLDGVGMNGCHLLQSAEVLGLGTSVLSPSTLAFSLPLPNAAALLDAVVHLQAYAVAPGTNALGMVASNAVRWRVGNL